MSYLSGNTKGIEAGGKIAYNRKKFFTYHLFCIRNFLCFFTLGMSFTAIGTFFKNNRLLFTRIGGIIIIVLGLFQIGIFDFKFLNRERRINYDPGNKSVNPLVALVMGFYIQLAWTPCIGPMLSSVLILASCKKFPL